MAYKLPGILGHKPADSLYRGMTASFVDRERPDGLGSRYTSRWLNLVPSGLELTFAEMSAQRKKGATREQMLSGRHIVYPGVSAAVTIEHDGKPYLALAKGNMPTGEQAAKLISGYVRSPHAGYPDLAVNEEMAEEFLPAGADGRVLPLDINIAYAEDEWYNGRLENPFPETLKTSDSSLVVSGYGYKPKGVIDNVIIDSATRQPAYRPSAFLWGPQNNVQFVYRFNVAGDFEGNRVSLHHSEDAFNQETEMLDAVLHPFGITLIELDDGDLTDNVFAMKHGQLEAVSPDITLSEAFAPKAGGFVTAVNIPLKEYLKLYRN